MSCPGVKEMSVEIKRIAYAYNGALEEQGLAPFFLDAYVSHDGQTVVDIHKAYATRAELYEAMEGIVPLLAEGGDPQSNDEELEAHAEARAKEYEDYGDCWQYEGMEDV